MPESDQPIERKLAAIFAADVAGYSRLMGQDEVATLRTLAAHREIMDRLIGEHRGRIANTAGDSVLAEFPSVVEAVQCAVQVQKRLREKNEGVPEDRQFRFRIGIHVGDVMVHGRDLLGDGVNIGARLQVLAEPGGVCVSGDVHQYMRRDLSLTFTDLGQQAVKNIEEGVRAYKVELGPDLTAPETRHDLKPLPLPDKPSIAVLPFSTITGDPEQEHLADGVAEEIIAALSRVRSFFVISRSSTFTYKGKPADPRHVSRELGVRYVVEGSVRRSGNRVRIMVLLIDATTGNHVWSNRYEGEASDIFDLQDRVTEAVVGAIEPNVTLTEIERAKRKRPDSLTAYDFALRALPAIWSQDRETTEEGLRLAERAMDLDPNYGLPRAIAAWCYAQRLSYLRTTNLPEDRNRANSLAANAVRLESNDALVLTCSGAAYSITGEHARAQDLIGKALMLDPNSAWAWHRSGWLNVYIRQTDRAIQDFQRAIRLSPLDPLMFNMLIGTGGAHFTRGDYVQAVHWIEKGLREKPDAVWAYRLLSASYFYAGRVDDAKQTLAAFCQAFPNMTVAKVLERTPGSLYIKERFAAAFKALGLPE